ncbi:hypothetical protein F2P56_002061 [Juglans regia]|uniref:DEAD/DEAH-box helicase domain-containing protein n=1 Tax=Juglans regia TaxID=51240 RepID=A0A833YFS6_JUGRE|nr:hypothetical protein F2P56_002061 [Juglans regia]
MGHVMLIFSMLPSTKVPVFPLFSFLLAQQSEKVILALGDYLDVKVHACVGGTSIHEDQRILFDGVHVVVGTPGRVFEVLCRKSLRPDYIRMFLLDKVDEIILGSKVGSVFMEDELTRENATLEVFDETCEALGIHIAAIIVAREVNYHSTCLHVLADSIRKAGLILACWLLSLRTYEILKIVGNLLVAGFDDNGACDYLLKAI